MSTPAVVPAGVNLAGLWVRERGDDGRLAYKAWYLVGGGRSMVYEIEREPYGKTAWMYQLWMNRVRVPLGFHSRLKDAQAQAQAIEDGKYEMSSLP